MRKYAGYVTTVILGVCFASLGAAQDVPPAPAKPNDTEHVVPEKVQPQAPSTSNQGDLSDKLKRTDGTITPPPGVDPKMTEPAPVLPGDQTPVIPPPGSPGGRQDIVPK